MSLVLFYAGYTVLWAVLTFSYSNGDNTFLAVLSSALAVTSAVLTVIAARDEIRKGP